MLVKIRRALISVSDKTKLDKLARKLADYGVEIICSGGTRDFIAQQGINVTPIEKVTGNPEAFGGRMKTLSFQISSSLLFRRNNPEDVLKARELGIEAIDLVVCNFYPFEEMLRKSASFEQLIENIDIGGPTMVRSAAKNFHSVCVCTNPSDYDLFMENLDKNEGSVDFSIRQKLSTAAFGYTAYYDGIISQVLQKENKEELNTITIAPHNAKKLRYGENPHQKGWIVKSPLEEGLAHAPSIQGKELSYNNLLDSDCAYRIICELDQLYPNYPFTAVVIKHGNPCGVAVADSPSKALELAWEGDVTSSFGSIIAFNKEVDRQCAEFLNSRFVELVLAPAFSPQALNLFSQKKNLRLITLSPCQIPQGLSLRSITGGFILQEEDLARETNLRLVTKVPFPLRQMSLIPFATVVTKHLKSNAIAIFQELSGGLALMGAGMGNPNRLISISQAIEKAGENKWVDFSQAVLISDAFFPFPDNINAIAQTQIKFIVQPGGSIKDQDVIEAADDTQMAMIFTGLRHFRH